MGTDQVKLIQDDLNYYVESNQDIDFTENEMMYDDIEMEDVQATFTATTGALLSNLNHHCFITETFIHAV